MKSRNALYAQSGGVTAVINTTASGVFQTARLHREFINKVYAANNGILGVLLEEFVDTNLLTDKELLKLAQTPSGAFGSCRYKLKTNSEYQRLIEIFKAHDIGYFFYNGGGDSQDTAHKISKISQEMNYPLTCIGIPKTIDNDLPFTDNCPGFGSVAKYVAISTLEAAFDVASMAASSTKVFILEVMGRHAGWIAASASLAKNKPNDPPHMILFPEIPFNQENFLMRVNKTVASEGYCVIVASEGIKNQEGKFLSDSGLKDAFGHSQLGGVAPKLASIIKENLGFKYHWAVADYLQRAARHIASSVDVEQAFAMGEAAVEFAIEGKNSVMPTIIRTSDNPYTWKVGEISLEQVANQEHKLPADFIQEDGFDVTALCMKYLRPLIQGENYPSYINGIPDYLEINLPLIPKKLDPWNLEKMETIKVTI